MVSEKKTLQRRRWLSLRELHTPHTLLALTIFFVAAVCFIHIADEIREKSTTSADSVVLRWIHGNLSTPLLNATLPTLSDIGGPVGVGIILLIAIYVFMKKKRVRSAVFLVVCLLNTAVLNLLFKAFFARPRPTLFERLVVETNFSFPSGHAMGSSALAFALIVTLWNTKWRTLSIVVGALYVCFVGFTRLYLGVHYPTDIIAGWCVSGALVALISIIMMHGKLGHPSNH